MRKSADDSVQMGVIHGSGNVFADLGLPNAEEELAKAELAFAIRRLINARNLSQSEAATLLGTDQAKVSLVTNGKVSGFTFDRLVRFLNALEMDVRITVEPSKNRKRGRTLVTVP